MDRRPSLLQVLTDEPRSDPRLQASQVEKKRYGTTKIFVLDLECWKLFGYDEQIKLSEESDEGEEVHYVREIVDLLHRRWGVSSTNAQY